MQAFFKLVLELDRMDSVSLFKVYKVFVELFGFDIHVPQEGVQRNEPTVVHANHEEHGGHETLKPDFGVFKA